MPSGTGRRIVFFRYIDYAVVRLDAFVHASSVDMKNYFAPNVPCPWRDDLGVSALGLRACC